MYVNKFELKIIETIMINSYFGLDCILNNYILIILNLFQQINNSYEYS